VKFGESAACMRNDEVRGSIPQKRNSSQLIRRSTATVCELCRLGPPSRVVLNHAFGKQTTQLDGAPNKAVRLHDISLSPLIHGH